MKFYKASILAIMICAAALFACSEQPGPDGRAAQETDEQPRAYFGDEDKSDVDKQQDGMNTQQDGMNTQQDGMNTQQDGMNTQQDGMNTQDDTGNVNQPQVQQPPQQDRQ